MFGALLLKYIFMTRYETVFILNPILSDLQVKETAKKFCSVITENAGVVTNEENWGQRKLAYPIQKKKTGYYILLEFDAPTDLVAKLEIAYHRDENVMRFLTFRLDKDAQEYAERRKQKLNKKEK
jgi:small subunit ribosomal protein S6